MQHLQPPIDQHALRDVVRRAIGKDTAVLGAWQVEPIAYHSVGVDSRGLHHIHGTAHTGAAIEPWSVVLKTFAAPADAATSDWAALLYWRREALAYRSGVLGDLRGRLRAPRCWHVDEQPNGDVWLWLEDVGLDDTRWSMVRYEDVARQLALFGGAFLHRHLVPAMPWLSRNVLRAWVEDAAPLIALIQQAEAWSEPLLRRFFPPATVAHVLQLWAERDVLIARLEQCPQTMCHHDLWRGNLVAHGDETVLLDWELVGVGALGEDLGNLLGVSLLNFDVDVADAALLADTLFSAYISGLQAAGWQGDEKAVAYAFNTVAALRSIFSTAGWPVAILRDRSRHVASTEQRWQRPIEQIVEQWAAVSDILLQRTEH